LPVLTSARTVCSLGQDALQQGGSPERRRLEAGYCCSRTASGDPCAAGCGKDPEFGSGFRRRSLAKSRDGTATTGDTVGHSGSLRTATTNLDQRAGRRIFSKEGQRIGHLEEIVARQMAMTCRHRGPCRCFAASSISALRRSGRPSLISFGCGCSPAWWASAEARSAVSRAAGDQDNRHLSAIDQLVSF